jgi:hypothetical protein
MKKNTVISIILVFVLTMSSAAFAMDGPGFVNIPLNSKQEVLFTLRDSEIGAPSQIRDLGYDKENAHLYFIQKVKEDTDEESDQEDPSVDLIDGLQIDPITGLQIDPVTGFLMDPETRLFVDPISGRLVRIDPSGNPIPVVPAQWYPMNPVTGVPQDPETGEAIAPIRNQLVYTMDGELVENPAYPLIEDMERKGIEFEAGNTWSLEQSSDESEVVLTNHDDRSGLKLSLEAKGFVVQGDQVVFHLGCDIANFFGFQLGSTEDSTLGDKIDSERNFVKAYDLSPDGSTLIYVETEGYWATDEIWYEKNYLVLYDLESETTVEYLISDTPTAEGYYSEAHDLYTTEDYIILLHKDGGEMKGYIERYTYEGELVDRVETNYCIRKITEGPGGSTIYVQMKYLATDTTSRSTLLGGDLEVIQINWDGKASSGSKSVGRMKPVIKEQTRTGQTIARFTNSQFGLLRIEAPETGIVDYQAPIRSKENLVNLQIPYCDIKAKLESGARNLMVEYQGQTLIFPMDLLDCDDILAAMPCQSDATIEIIMHTDETGTVTYEVQLFVVEQVNAMTRVVHRKTIQ